MASTMTEYRKRRAQILDYLGSACVECSATANLEIDHIDHSAKAFDISKNWSIAWERLEPELDKCQILCKKCHIQKSMKEGSLKKDKAIGSRVKGSKLTENKVRDIKAKLKEGSSMASLSREYEVSYEAIKHIKYGVTWKHIGA